MTGPIVKGAVLAAVSAIAFGLTTPVIAWAGRSAGPLEVAALLYAGPRLPRS